MAVQMDQSPIEILNASRPAVAPVDVNELARKLGLRVHHTLSLPETVSGAIKREQARGEEPIFRIFVNANDHRRRQRFTLAHEIAHYVLHRDMIGDGITDDAMYRSSLGDDYERQANRMAASILMPAQLVRQYYRGGMISLAPLAEMFDVSSDAIRIRLKELGFG